MNPRLTIIGSANYDLVVKAERIPTPGETIIGGKFLTSPGGKGANQAVAAARLGADVWFVGRVGTDSFGESLSTALAGAGVRLDYLIEDAVEPTGVALIGVDARGENAITVAPGANGNTSADDVESARPAITSAFAVLLQLEIPMAAVRAAIRIAKESGAHVILNPAPVSRDAILSADILTQVDVLTPNEHEAAIILGLPSTENVDWNTAALRLLEAGVGTVVITLGVHGSIVADSSGVRALPAYPVDAVDTTAAGDCFSGALAVALAEGRSIDDAVRFASGAAAISVTRMGAQPSLPTRAEVDELICGK